MDTSFFSGIKPEYRQLSTGSQFAVPWCVYECTAMMASFPASTVKVKELLPSKRLEPVQLVPGRAIIAVAAIEYRQHSDEKPFNEVSIMIPVIYQPRVNVPGIPLVFPEWFKRFGLYVYQIPVTTREAQVPGLEIWGVPKSIADITFRDSDEARSCTLSADGRDVLTLSVKKLLTRRKRSNYWLYGVKDGRLLRFLNETQGYYGKARFARGASLELGSHPTAERLKALNIGTAAAEYLYVTGMQSVLHLADAVFDL